MQSLRGIKLSQVLIHYDVSSHIVNLQTFIKAAQATQQAVDSIGEFYFGSEISFEVVVIAPEAGTLKEILGIRVPKRFWNVATLLLVLEIMDSQSVKDVSTELFGNTPSGGIVTGIKTLKEWVVSEDRDPASRVEQDKIDPLTDIVCNAVTKSFEMDRERLRNAEIPEKLRFSLEDSQSLLFEGALADQSVAGIGFSSEDHFPIKRHQFVERAIRPTPIENPAEVRWVSDIINVKITSPNFDREDQIQRKWKGKTYANKSILFEISDEEFWTRSRRGDITFTENSEIKIQLAIKIIKGKAREKIAIRVISVDNKELAIPLTDDAIKAMIGEFTHRPVNDMQDDLFGS